MQVKRKRGLIKCLAFDNKLLHEQYLISQLNKC